MCVILIKKCMKKETLQSILEANCILYDRWYLYEKEPVLVKIGKTYCEAGGGFYKFKLCEYTIVVKYEDIVSKCRYIIKYSELKDISIMEDLINYIQTIE